MTNLKTARRSLYESINWQSFGYSRLWRDRIVFNDLKDTQGIDFSDEIRTNNNEQFLFIEFHLQLSNLKH